MAQGLRSLLSSVDPGRDPTTVSCRPISGGYSRVTTVAEVQWDDGAAERLILRSDPPGGKGVFNSERDPEWELLQALAKVDTIVIPEPRWYDGTGAHFGTKCIVMEHCEGMPLQLTLPGLDDFGPATEVYLQVAAAIHATPLDALPADMERPADWDSYIDSAIDIYEQTERGLADSSPITRYVSAWLKANKPPPVPLALVHGDLQPGNILVADGRPPVIIDWEFTRVGDPREDIGYYSQSPLPDNLYQADPERFLARYRELSGMSEEQLNPDVMRYFFVLGMAKLFAQMMEGADAVAESRGSGIMNLFLVNSLSYFHGEYLKICKGAPR
jgi:aminoglycoside phosphotransferase (APT) family kinase protein